MTAEPEDVSSSPDSDGEQDIDMSEHQDQEKENRSSNEPAVQSNGGRSTKPNASAKDPQRPRRKKARRACYACQRAHLTCGKSCWFNERRRPCV